MYVHIYAQVLTFFLQENKQKIYTFNSIELRQNWALTF